MENRSQSVSDEPGERYPVEAALDAKAGLATSEPLAALKPRTRVEPRRPERPLSFTGFRREVEALADDGRQGLRYLRHQLRRFYDTYRFILRAYGAPRRLASFGAGSAYVEAVLAGRHGTEVVVFDFPSALELHGEIYDRFGFRFVPVDLTQPAEAPPDLGPVDLILCAEIVEHLPVAPSEQLAANFRRLGQDAPVVVTTPNAGSLRQIAKLVFMRPLLPPPELTFGEVCFENEGVHRREYMASEIFAAFEAVGHKGLATAYCWYHLPREPAELALFPLERLSPRFRPCMIIGSQPR
jgi:hypothetical protein